MRRIRTAWAAVWVVVCLAGAGAQVDQRPGKDADFGKDYRLCREEPLEFRLKSVEYNVSRVRFGETCKFVLTGTKLLVLHFSVQNARNEERLFRFDSILFTAVDANHKSFDGIREFGVEGSGDQADLNLKPAQRIDCYAVVEVPADTVLPKLLVLPYEDDAPILRYKLDGKLPALPAPYAAAEDKTGLTPAEEIAGQPGTLYSLGPFDVRCDKAGPSTQVVKDCELEEGKSWYAVSLTLKNQAPDEQDVAHYSIHGLLVLADDSEVNNPQLVMPESGKAAEFTVKPKGERSVRLFFPVGADEQPKTIRVWFANGEGESRPVVFAVKDVPKA